MTYFYYFMGWTYVLGFALCVAFLKRGQTRWAMAPAAIAALFFIAAECTK